MDDLLCEIDVETFVEWIAFDSLEPSGGETAVLRALVGGPPQERRPPAAPWQLQKAAMLQYTNIANDSMRRKRRGGN